MKKIVKTLLVLLVGLGILGSSVQVAFASQPSSNYSEGEVAGEYVSSAQEFTSIDEDGTYHPLSEDELTLDSDRSNFSNGIMQLYYNPDIDYATGVVNFRTKSSALYNTEYTEDGTGIAGYTNGYYGADAAFLGYSGDMTQVKFMLSGVTGWVKSSEVSVYDNSSNGYNVSYYIAKSGKFYHYACYNMAVNGGSPSYSAIYQGTKPGYLSNDVKYYSYDGHYFYTSYATMLTDYKNNTRSNAVNGNNPYYNYYQYLSHRSTSVYTAAQLNEAIASLSKGTESSYGRTSKMKNQGSSFINNQNEYGANSMLAIGVAGNESAWGCSNLAYDRNNLFGHAAYDSDPDGTANGYSSVEYAIRYHCSNFISLGYLDALTDNRYYGSFLGNKASGINVKYASDPYWGEKAAANAWRIDDYLGNKDSNKYTIGIKDTLSNNHNTLNIKASASDSSTTLYTTKMYKGTTNSPASYAFIVLGKDNGYYKIQSDMQVNSSRSKVVNQESYTFGSSYAYVKQSDVITLVNSGSNSVSDIIQDENFSISTNYASPRPSQEAVQITANTSYASMRTYKFTWMKDNWNKWGVIQESSNKTCSWVPKETGTYTIYVDVTDVYGNIVTKTINYTITAQNFIPASISVQGGNLLTSYDNKITGSVSGNTTGLKYRFVWMKDNWNEWGVIQETSTSNSCTFNPKTTGTYEIYMDVHATDGTIKTISTVVKTAVDNWKYNSVNVSGTFQSGGTINVVPDITGNTSNLQYKYVWMKNDWNEWGVIKDYSGNSSCGFVPTSTGDYEIYVDVRDSAGRIKTLTKAFTVNKQVITFNSISTNLASPQYVGKGITITANTSGNNNGLKYKYVWMKDDWNEWGVISNFSTSNKTTWTPKTAGDYTLYVDVQSLDGVIITKTIKYTVKTISYKDITVSGTAGTGNTLTIKPNITGDTTGVKYKYVWMRDTWDNWGVIPTDTSSQSATFVPSKPGTYKFYVDVTDAGGTIVTQIYTVNVPLSWNYSSVTLSKYSAIRGTEITITPVVSNGSNLKYKYVWMKNDWNEWGVISNFSTSSTCKWIPTTPGTYSIYTDIEDSYGNIVTRTRQITIN